MISSTVHQSQDSFDPWVVPDPPTVELLGDSIPLSLAEEQHVAVQAFSDTPSCDESHIVTSDSLPDWLNSTPSSSDHILETFPMDEPVLDVMSLGEWPCEDLNHRASFSPDLTTVEKEMKPYPESKPIRRRLQPFNHRKVQSGLQNAGATSQRAMSHDFHDIKHLVEPHLDDLPAHSARQEEHYEHLRAISLRCHHYNICLNPHKCSFCVETGRHFGFHCVPG